MTLYMAVTPDEFEMPIYITDSLKDMANRFNVKKNVVSSSIAHKKNGKQSGRKFVRIEVDDE